MSILAFKNIGKNNLFNNFSILAFSNVLTQCLTLFVSIKLARSLSPSLFGTYYVLQLHTSIFVMLASLGLRNIIIRTVARNKNIAGKVFFQALIIKSIGFLISIACFTIYFYLYTQYDFWLFISVILCILSVLFFDLMESIFFGLEEMKYSGIINLSCSFLWVISIMLIPESFLTLHLIFSLYVFFNILKTIIYFIAIYRLGPIKGFSCENIDKLQIINLTKESFPYYYLAFFTLLSNQIPLLFLEYRSSVDQIGFFNIASKILLPVNLVVLSALTAILPHLSKNYLHNYQVFIKNVRCLFIIFTLFALTSAIGISLFKNEVIYLLFGSKYINSGLVLDYQGWYVSIYSIVCLIGTLLSAIDKQKELSYLSLVCTVIQVPILWYGSKYGAQNFSLAFLVATLITLIFHLFIIRKYLKDEISRLFYLKILGAFTISYLMSLATPADLNVFYKSIFFGLVLTASSCIIIKIYKESLRKYNY